MRKGYLVVLVAGLLSACQPEAQPGTGQPVGQPGTEWRLTMQLLSGSRFCNLGERATIRIRNNALSLFYQGESFPRWTVPLAADGSADAVVRAIDDNLQADQMQVRVPAGTAPREITAVSQRDACRMRLIPD